MRCTQEGGTDGVGGVGIGREVGMGRLRLGVVGEGGEAGDERLEAVGRATLLGILLGGLTRLESQVSESAGAKDQIAKLVLVVNDDWRVVCCWVGLLETAKLAVEVRGLVVIQAVRARPS